MNTVQVQKVGNDQSPNTADTYGYAGNGYMDWKTLAVGLVAVAIVWGIGLFATSMQCAAIYAATCTSFSLVLYAPLAIAFIGLAGVTVAGVWYLVNSARKNALANARWQHFHYADARAIYAQTIAVALQDAKSSATSQLDNFTYSPSNSSNTTNKQTETPDSALKDPLKDAKIAIEDIFSFKED